MGTWGNLEKLVYGHLGLDVLYARGMESFVRDLFKINISCKIGIKGCCIIIDLYIYVKVDL